MGGESILSRSGGRECPPPREANFLIVSERREVFSWHKVESSLLITVVFSVGRYEAFY